VAELLVEWVVQPQLCSEPSQGLGISPLAHHGLDRIARSDVQQEKGDQQNAEQGGDQE
jgi:hypothetical protein